jgi:predicted Fe-Mo cluster-binding NifX family protein
MKIAVSTDGNALHDKIDQRFGRCPNFLIIEVNGKEVGTFEAIKNDGVAQGHGAGIRAAEQLGELKVEAVITGQLGPNATNVLSELGIKAYSASGVITDALVNFTQDKLELITAVSEAHNGLSESTDKISEEKTVSAERIFFPLLDDKGVHSQISDHFGQSPFFGLYDVGKSELKIIPNDLNHSDPNKSPIEQIQDAVNPSTIFAKGIGGKAIGIIKQKGLHLKTGDYKTVAEVLDNLDNLEDQTASCGQEHE